ncbi:hypothetical protein AMJ87_05500 [candidate division WOR_3 bacterium SM23_60]|uniref:Uncharacterized protein n=1 Tax=candidate division WOR_3 bacterium SM23_60 TaxID=1703780 RepID=A0A0S8GHD6_UNCW3|nr:MAG: hypothetical protein AMJ87_05500 [candidate division WOR_3 bacterium SM23_60]
MDKATRKVYDNALELYNTGEIKQSIEKLTQVISAYPDYPDVHHALGCAFSLADNYDEAINSFKRAIELNPNYIEAYVDMAIVQNELCKFEDAKQSFERAAVLETKDRGLSPQLKAKLANIYTQLGDTYYELQEYEKAKDEYRRGTDMGSSFLDIKLKLAKTHLQLSEYEETERILFEVLEHNQNYFEARTTLGLCYYRQQKFLAAQKQWQEVLEADPGNIKAKSYLNMLKEKLR